MIPFVDLAPQHRSLAEELEHKLHHLLETSEFILGREVEEFENEFARYVGVDHAVGVASGTAALELACEALLEPGDEVIVPAHTYVATAFAVTAAGCVPRFVDVTEGTFTLDPNAFDRAVGPRTRAVIPVHIYGHPASMGEITEIARRRGLRIIEDCAQAHGATVEGSRVGSLGDAGCFSFYPSKNLGALGDGGMVVTRDPALRDRLRSLRHMGQRVRNTHELVGHNARLDSLQAGFLRVKLPHLDRLNGLRKRAADWYGEELREVGVLLPVTKAGYTHVYHIFAVRHPGRDTIQATLSGQKIGCGVYYPTPVHLQPCYRGLGYRAGAFPVAERLALDSLALPMFPEIERAQVARVAEVVRASLREV